MQITYLIGNGFDINLGLKTSYLDFYKEIKEESNNLIIKAIKDKPKEWSNLEEKLGDYTSLIGIDGYDLEEFLEEKCDLDSKLSDYLVKEQERVDWNNKANLVEVKEYFDKYISEYYNHLNLVDRSKVTNVYDNTRIFYKIISFNYTNSILKCREQTNHPLDIVYVHGDLENRNIILGVNDTEQIYNQDYRDNEELQVEMCKLRINNFEGENTINKIETIMFNSKIICVFGMSIGRTDKHWWEILIKGLLNNFIEYIIIFDYYDVFNDEFEKRKRFKVLQRINFIKDELLKYSDVSDSNIKKSLKSRIIVKSNTDMFKLNIKFKDAKDSVVENGEILLMN